MLKARVTIKEVMQSYNKVFQACYCELQNILTSSPRYYNDGIYGWNCDIYVNDELDIAIITGYRNLSGDIIPKNLVKKYNNFYDLDYNDYKDGYLSYTELHDLKVWREKMFWEDLSQY